MSEMERVLNLAIDAEKEANKLYTEAASKTNDPSNKQVYLWLAREEIGHQMLLSAELSRYKNGEKFISKKDVKDAAISSPLESSEFPSFVKPFKKADVTAGEDELIKKAMKAEAEASAFYRGLAEETSDNEAKSIFTELSQIEKGHLELLTEELKLINEGASMFLLRRFESPLPE
jgi:rubrerythrin